jgi:hypothetical protein
MKKQYPEIEHQFDVWHLANSVCKKLLAKSKLRGADLGPWIKAICNHLWWCSSNSSGNKEWLEESFILLNAKHQIGVQFQGIVFSSDF